MIVEVGPGVLGQSVTHWGQTASGDPVLVFQTAQATVRVAFSAEEARDHGCAAIYVATLASLHRLAASKGDGAGALEPSSALLGVDGLPLTRRGA